MARRSFTCISTGISPISSRKSVPAVGELEAPGLAVDRPGEGPALVAEELGLHQVAGDRPAVHPDEGLVLARAVLVEGARDELLARARLARDEHRRGGVGHLLQDRVDLLHRRVGADDLVAPLAEALELHVAGAQVARAQRLGDDVADLRQVEGLGDEVEGPAAHRLHRGVDGAVGGDHDHREVGVVLLAVRSTADAVELVACAGR
jgi:hypothetical protein